MHIHNGERADYGKGSAWILSYCDCHGFDYKANSFVTSIVFDESMLNPELAKLITGGVSKYNCVFSDEELKEVSQLAKRLRFELMSENPLKDIMASALLTDIIIRIIRLSDENFRDGMPSNVQKAVSYIYKNFRTNISLKGIADEFSVSANYLGEQFKSSMGMSFNAYLNAVRLRYCCNLLLSSDMAVKEVAYSGGYSSVEYFLQVFKKTMDMTPSEYRKKENKRND